MLNDPITTLKGIGPKKAEQIRRDAGIETVEDLLYYIPRRYVDRSYFKLIKDCFVNETVTVSGTIRNVALAGRRRKFLEVEIDDSTDSLTGVFFGGIRYFMKIFSVGDYVIFSGKMNFYLKKQIVHPDFDFIDDTSGSIHAINTGRIIPLYRSTENLKSLGFDSRGFRRIIKSALDACLTQVEDTIDWDILNRHALIGIREALYAIHFPDTFEQAEEARKRLAFNELFFHQYYLSLSRRYLRETKVKKQIDIDDSRYRSFLSSLLFQLTADQKTAIDEIRRDIESPYPMNRLLQGDVGSGKTVVAMAAVLLACGQGRQAALMAPTEILAQQHFINFQSSICRAIRTVLLTGGMPRAEKQNSYEMITSGGADLVIGTHALIQEDVVFRDLGLVIIDEQHRFGVEQRSALRLKGDVTDLLVMTATPIPRSLSLTIYGDLHVTSIRTMPASRLPVKTMAFGEARLDGVYRSIEKYISQGRQSYYVLPLIEESDKIDLKSAIQVYDFLKKSVFPARRVELLHGRMNQEERDSVMYRFKNGDIDILVCTTVIEVGIDVPNVTVIVIEHAERFGLAQLHQLRGRVGRGREQSFCILISPDDISDESRKRIETIVSTNDGFIIAEEDLRQRGAGELIGVLQHGHGKSFEFADLSLDIDLILYARDVAEKHVSEIIDVASLWEQFMHKKYSPLLNGIRNKKILSILS
ncbi:MAG: ATP-dependent DNA helicase RecG [Spirochaetes bacterium RBG_13_51_14]|nr:MAG: ATP-dependent DNA helicase RecG [Spirochaetes bacterium RBG_13_51_14]